jgi:lauroyl/myristoyl acyltransferase
MNHWFRRVLPRAIVDASQYLPALFALILLQSVPYKIALRIGSALAVTACAFDVRHRRVIRDNLLLAFGGAGLSEPERRWIARCLPALKRTDR